MYGIMWGDGRGVIGRKESGTCMGKREKQRVGSELPRVTGGRSEQGKNQTTLHNILQEKKRKEPGTSECGAKTGFMIGPDVQGLISRNLICKPNESYGLVLSLFLYKMRF